MGWRSLPSRERGLKFDIHSPSRVMRKVAPFTGAWIEIPRWAGRSPPRSSLPSRERGLKSELDAETDQELRVAPFTGAWIEMILAVVA